MRSNLFAYATSVINFLKWNEEIAEIIFIRNKIHIYEIRIFKTALLVNACHYFWNASFRRVVDE